jgi:hypothetical protein
VGNGTGTHALGELPLEYGVIKLNGFIGVGGEDPIFCGFARAEKQLEYVRQVRVSFSSLAAHFSPTFGSLLA